MGSSPPHWNHFPSLCPPGSSQPGHQLTRTLHPIWGGGAGKVRAPRPSRCLDPEPAQSEGAWRETPQPGRQVRPLGLPGDRLCEAPRVPLEGSQSPRVGMGRRAGDPCRPGPGLTSHMEGSGAEAEDQCQGRPGGLGPRAHSCWGQLGLPSRAGSLLASRVAQRLSSHVLLRQPGVPRFGSRVQTYAPLIKPCWSRRPT